MHIGMFTDTYEPKIDGIVSSIKTYTAELEKRGHTVKIYSPKNAFFREEHTAHPDNTRIPSLSYYAYPDFRLSLPYDPRLVNNIRKEKFDVIHTHTPGSIGLLGIGAARLFGIRSVHTYHTNLEEYLHYFPAPEIISKYGVKKFVAIYMNRHDACIAPSTAVKRLLTDYGVSVPVHVLPSGVNFDDFDNLQPQPKAYPYIMSMSRIGREKNLAFLVKAFVLVSKSHPDIHFIIAGGGPYEDELREIVKASPVHDRIHLTGFIKHGELFPLVAGAKVFLSASTTETQGLTTLEALACGTPVVAVKASGVEDTLAGDNGGYLVPEDLEKFAEKVSLLLNNSEIRTAKSKEAKLRANDFSIESCTDKLLGVYKS
ncbi:MAG: glycosyltransferase [Candidatus Paceibacterota bacterium]|jgi:glycosyltransferase involved in cell wall biosynthesis